MTHDELLQVLDFLRAAESLKTVVRSGWTSAGERESVAEHTWRLCLMALVLGPALPEVDFARLVRICIVHDLGEAIGGDVPAPEQVRRGTSKTSDERRDLLTLVAALPAVPREEIVALWDEYEAGVTPEAQAGQGARQAGDDPAAHAGEEPRATSTIASTWTTGAGTPRGTRCWPSCGRSWTKRPSGARARRRRTTDPTAPGPRSPTRRPR
jgi:hypothetical protein